MGGNTRGNEDDAPAPKAPNELDALRMFVTAHASPDPRTGSREPIWYMPFRGGLMHHALEGEHPVVDDALIEQMHDKGLISIDFSGNTWKVTPTELGRSVLEETDRTRGGRTTADVAPILAACARQAEASNPLAWPAVRPVLDAFRVYWQESGYPHYGIPLTPVVEALPDSAGPLFAATARALVAGGYFNAGWLSGTIIDDNGLKSQFPSEVALTEKSHAILDGWPGAAPSELVENLLAVLSAAAANETDPVRRTRLESLAGAVREVGISVTSDVIAKVVTGGVL